MRSTHLVLALLFAPLGWATAAEKNIVFIAGGPSHAPLEHEHRAGSLLLKKCLAGVPGVKAEVYENGWPTTTKDGKTVDNNAVLEAADAIIIYSDGGLGHPLLQGDRLALVDRLVKRGTGLGLIHYAVEPTLKKGQAEFLDWVGGAFETHWSVNPIWEASFTALPQHPVTRGVKPFASRDEWYFHMRFRDGSQGVTPILSAVAPAATMSRQDGPHSGNPAVREAVKKGTPQTVMWVSERGDGGRGFGFTGGHFHLAWGNDDQRKSVLNAILWAAKAEVPANGVESKVTEADLQENLDDKPGAKPAAAAAAMNSTGEPAPTVVPPELFTVPEGFEVTLWAQSPMVRNPTNIDIDAQGRIWVTEGVNYRSHLGRDKKGDRVVVLEDTNGNGRADKATTFVQEPGAVAPLGIAVIDNKVIVSDAPDMIVYTDVDRDNVFDARVDKRDVLLSGFNGHNHDHSLHSITVGPDGLWYWNQGNAGALFTDRSGKTFRISSGYDPERPLFGWRNADLAGAKSDDGHVYIGGFAARMRPDGTRVEVIGHNFRNSYEQTITSFGDVFQNDNDDPPACRTSFLLEYGNAGFFSLDGKRIWNADRRPGQSIPVAHWRQEDPHTMPPGDVYGGGAPTGIVFHEGDELGAQYRGLLLSAESARNTIFGYLPKPDGAGFTLERFDFLTTNREREFAGTDFKGGDRSINKEMKYQFRPSDVAVGPDGAIYVADWFDPRVGGHQDLDDSTSGAIYRIAPKGLSPVPPKFNLETVQGQIAALKSPAVNVRSLGFERLRARGADAVKPVSLLLRDRNPYIRARAVWLLAAIGGEGTEIVKATLSNSDPQLRIVAFRALRRFEHPELLSFAAQLAKDSVPSMRREVAVAMRDVPFSQSRDILLELARSFDGNDRTYLAAWGIGATNKEKELYAALAETQPEKDATKWTQAYAKLIWRITPSDAAPELIARASSETLPEAQRLEAVTALGFMPTQAASNGLLDLAEKASGQVKSHAMWWLLNYKDSRWKEMGVNEELKRRGLYDRDKVVISSVTMPPVTPSPLPPLEELLKLTGNPTRGQEKAQSCLTCHRIGSVGIEYGPTLTGFASRQPTEVVINAIVKPSNDIAHGYGGTEFKLKDGTTIHGLVLSSGDPYVVQSIGGLTQMIPADKVETRRRLERSLMLSASELGLSGQDVVDIVEWLKTQ